MSDTGPQKGPASTARIIMQGRAGTDSWYKKRLKEMLEANPDLMKQEMQNNPAAIGVDWGKGDSLTVAALPAGLFDDYACTSVLPHPSRLMRAAGVFREAKQAQQASRIDFLCITKATWDLLKEHPDMQSEETPNMLRAIYQGLPVEVFDTEFECVLHIRMRYAADGKNGLLVKGPEITV